MHLFALRSQIWFAGHWLRRTQSLAVLASRHRPNSSEQNCPKGQGRLASHSSPNPGRSWHW